MTPVLATTPPFSAAPALLPRSAESHHRLHSHPCFYPPHRRRRPTPRPPRHCQPRPIPLDRIHQCGHVLTRHLHPIEPLRRRHLREKPPHEEAWSRLIYSVSGKVSAWRFQCECFSVKVSGFSAKMGVYVSLHCCIMKLQWNESHLVHVRGRGEGEKHVQARQLPPLCRYKERCCPIDGYLEKKFYVHDVQ